MFKKFAKWLENCFIPHKHNGHQPHILKKEAVLAILTIVFFCEIFFIGQTFFVFKKTDFFASILPNVIVDLANSDRAGGDISQLRVNEKLQAAAQMKADDMAKKEYFSHTSPSGITPWHWFGKAGYDFSYAGENLAINFFDSADVNSAWMASAAHRKNIMNGKFTEIGIGVAKGKYQGKDSVFIVQLFGRPASPAAPKAVSKNTAAAIKKSEASDDAASAKKEEVLSAETGDSFLETGNNADLNPENNFLPEGNSALPSKSSNADKLLASPRSYTNYIFMFLLSAVFLALILKIFIKIKVQYPRLIINGFLLLAVISSVILFNKYVSVVNAMIF